MKQIEQIKVLINIFPWLALPIDYSVMTKFLVYVSHETKRATRPSLADLTSAF